jgi:hypothetical protein
MLLTRARWSISSVATPRIAFFQPDIDRSSRSSMPSSVLVFNENAAKRY